METKNFNITGMCCDYCVTKITKALEAFPQLENLELKFDAPQLKVTFKDDISEQDIIQAIVGAGHYTASSAN